MSKRKDEIPDVISLKKLKVPELKQLCESCGLAKHGVKNDLITRLDQARGSISSQLRDGAEVDKCSRKSFHQSSPKSLCAGRSSNTVDPRQSAPSRTGDRRQRCMDLFAEYAGDENSNKILMEGFVRFGQDLAHGDAEEAVTPRHSFFMFYLSWKMKALSFAELPKEGFVSGLEAMQCFSIEELVQKRDVLLSEVANKCTDSTNVTFEPNDRFVAMYMAIFDMLKVDGKKYVEKGMAIEALQALFCGVPGNASPHTEFFVRFLKEKETIGSLNADQWRGFLGFSREVGSDFAGYSDVDPWPSLLDDFVSWCKAQPDWKAKNGMGG